MDERYQVVGYPGFRAEPRGRTLVPTGFGGLAVRKMSDVVYLRASFAGEEYAYDPLLTVRVWDPATAVLAGVYRTDTTLYPDLAPDEPSRCLLVATWNRDDDMARGIAAYHAGGDDGVRDYLAFGPQLDVSLLFTSETRTPELHGITSEFLDAMSAGVTITPAANDSPAADWWGIEVHAGTMQVSATVDYAPWLSSCPVVEERLPAWLQRTRELATESDLEPDDDPLVAVRESVAELIARPIRVSDRRMVDGGTS